MFQPLRENDPAEAEVDVSLCTACATTLVLAAPPLPSAWSWPPAGTEKGARLLPFVVLFLHAFLAPLRSM